MEKVGDILPRLACGKCGHSLRRHFVGRDSHWHCVFCPADRVCAISEQPLVKPTGIDVADDDDVYWL